MRRIGIPRDAWERRAESNLVARHVRLTKTFAVCDTKVAESLGECTIDCVR